MKKRSGGEGGDGKRQEGGEPEIHAFRFVGLCHVEQSL